MICSLFDYGIVDTGQDHGRCIDLVLREAGPLIVNWFSRPNLYFNSFLNIQIQYNAAPLSARAG